MAENTVLIIVLSVAGLVLVGVAVYYLLRFMRGTIKMTLTQTAFNPGETIKGSFIIQTKKPIEGNKLIVSLIGVQETKTRDGEKSESHSREIYRNEVLIEGAKVYPAGFESTHDFEIPTPDTGSQEFLNSGVGQALTAALSLLSNRRTEFRWKVEARLDAKGIDLATSKRVTLNMNQFMQ
jgi:hypothetical protein